MAATTESVPVAGCNVDRPVDNAAHHDDSRAAVPSTNIMTAWLRALESQKPSGERIMFDPFAELFCRDARINGLDPGEAVKASLRKDGQSLERWVDTLAIRTRWIDDVLDATMPSQLVIMGAGLDARACRLEVLRDVPVFELDFPEVLESKRTLLGPTHAIADLHYVPAKFGVDDWLIKLLAAGFTETTACTWVLEGLTGYLTSDELDALFVKLGSVAAPGSTMVATFVGDCNGTDMHRTSFNDAEQVSAFVANYGWTATVVGIQEAGSNLSRTGEIPEDWNYFLVTATR